MLLQRTEKRPDESALTYEISLGAFRAQAIKNNGRVHLRDQKGMGRVPERWRDNASKSLSFDPSFDPSTSPDTGCTSGLTAINLVQNSPSFRTILGL
jgi:hypothetical protein